jgi:hypothetical protein
MSERVIAMQNSQDHISVSDLPDPGTIGRQPEVDPASLNTDFDPEAPDRPVEEIPLSDLQDDPSEGLLHSPDMSDMNVPGAIDIEDLSDDALDDILPPDARLDRLEE